ncbi:DUF1524 domain-containing protein (plasmid) [Citricoccus nitrophenolicus]
MVVMEKMSPALKNAIRYPLAGLAIVLALTGCTSTPADTTGETAGTQSSSATVTVESEETGQVAATPSTTPSTAGSAREALDTLAVKGRAPKTGYDRELFGQAWEDVDRNGCDTRNDILNRDLEVSSHKPGTSGCVVLTGTLNDPFTGTAIDFERGPNSADVQIDHLVALSDSWQKGAQSLSPAERVALANDPINLLAVDGPSNSSKGDGDAATWLPPQKSFRCDYVARQVAVKAKYELWVTQAEHDAIANILDTCPGQELPDAGTTYDITPGQAAKAEPTAEAQPEEATGTPAAGEPFKNCAAARAAGAAPVMEGDPGWGTHLDGDGDGVGCQ